MTDLKTLLDSPISWQSAAKNPDIRHFLQDLQANILKSHGRHHAGHVFISFYGMSADSVAALVRQLSAYCTSAYTQLRTNKKYPPHLDGGPVRCLFLSASGYKALGRHAKTPTGDAFAAGMAGRKDVLSDPPRAKWDQTGWRDHAPDAMFLVADADADAVTRDLQDISGWLNGTGARILVIERGLQQTRQFRPGQKAEAVEHFGYVDGRSQPLFLHEDLEDEQAANAQEPADPFGKNSRRWDAEFKPSQFIVADPNGTMPLAAGSFFVFRKLEQDIRGFNAAEDALGKTLFGDQASTDELDRAGAMIVGRFEDGTPLVLNGAEQGLAVPNGFTYDNDVDASRCPFHAHIRKVNPRGDVKRTFKLPDESGDRAPIMARRGITYGPERPKTPDGKDFADDGTEPQHNSGLLFMAYMASLEKQFEFTQQSWANNANFVVPKNGVDPVIGQTNDPAGRQYTFQDGYTPGMEPKVASFDQFVHMMGGEYFFAPSLSFLRSVGL